MKAILAFLIAAILTVASLPAETMSVEDFNDYKGAMEAYFDYYRSQMAAGEVPPIKCLTPVVLQMEQMRPLAASPMSIFDRQDTLSFSYGTTNFLFHYTNLGTHAVYEFNQQDSVAGVPNFVYIAARQAEFVLNRYVTELGYPGPISDTLVDTLWDGRLDIYLADVGGQANAFGLTYLIDGTYPPMTTPTYLILENDFAGFAGYANDRISPLLVTLAHELFHTIHFAIDKTEVEIDRHVGTNNASPAWLEMTGTYGEEEMYDNVNDYYTYLPYFYGNPQFSLRDGTQFGGTLINYNLHMYGSVIWPLFLVEKFGPDIIRDIWLQCGSAPGPQWIQATKDQIAAYSADSLDLREMFKRFTQWNAFTGNWTRGTQYFDEALNYNKVNRFRTVTSYPTTISPDTTKRPGNLGASYIELQNLSSSPSGLAIAVDLDRTQPWDITVIGLPANPGDLLQDIWIDTLSYDSNTTRILLPNAPDFDKMMIIAAVLDGNLWETDYTMNITPLAEGVATPSGGEELFVGNPYAITWFLGDSVTTVRIELSIDNGQSWTEVTTTANSLLYQWTVPDTPSDQCLIRITDIDNPTTQIVSASTFTIQAIGATTIFEPYPNPIWTQNYSTIHFKGLQETGSGSTGDMSVTILTLSGDLVRKLFGSGGSGSEVIVDWDLTNEGGAPVAAGPYLAVIEFAGQTEVKKFLVLQ